MVCFVRSEVPALGDSWLSGIGNGWANGEWCQRVRLWLVLWGVVFQGKVMVCSVGICVPGLADGCLVGVVSLG